MKLSNYSLNYRDLIIQGSMDIFKFLALCRELGLDGASVHLQNLQSTQTDYLKQIRRAYLDNGLSVSMFTVSTDFGQPQERHEEEFKKFRQALRAAELLGAPLIRVFAGAPRPESDRANAFDRSAAAIRRACEEAAQSGVPIGLQNHNHGALCRTGDEIIRFIKKVDHPNFTFVLDTGQWAGSQGASGPVPPELRGADFMESIRQTASMARYVRMKFYSPRADGSEPAIPYDKVFDILRGVHYAGFVDMVYEPLKVQDKPGEDVRTALPRVAAFLRSRIQAAPTRQVASPVAARYVGLDSGRYFTEPASKTETAAAFLEGPAVDRQGNCFFTNGQMEHILRWDPGQKKLTLFRDKSNGANGLRFDRNGRLLACEDGRVTRTEMASGKITVLADNFQGQPLGGPNDLDIDARGRIYFTSRVTERSPKTRNVNAVYRIDPEGTVTRILAAPAIDMPNGLATSPDDKRLYLIDADGRDKGSRRIRVYDLKPDGSVTNERLLYDFYPGRSGDGMAVDAEGNLYVAAGLHRRRNSSETLDTRPGIHVISPQGKLVAFLETPEDTITNCRFGGPDLTILYVTCGKLLLSMRTRIPGKSTYRPDA